MKYINLKLLLVIVLYLFITTKSKGQESTSTTYDVGVESIDMDLIVPQSIMFPLATVKNYGSQECSFEVRLKIGDEIERTYFVSNLEPGNIIQIQFNDVNPAINVYNVTCFTKLLNGLYDENLSNDTSMQKMIVLDYSIIRGFSYSDIYSKRGIFYSYCFSPNFVHFNSPYINYSILSGSAVSSDNQVFSISSNSNSFYRWYHSPFGDLCSVAATVVPNGGSNWSGLTFDYNLDKFIVSSNSAANSYIYTISKDNFTVSLLTELAGLKIQAVASKGDGYIYCIDINSDTLLKINLADYRRTTIGHLGFDAVGCQSIEFEKNTSILFYTAQHADGTADIRLLDINDASSIVLTQYDNQFMDAIVIQNVSALPVELTAFVCVKIANKVLLNWQTATEKNNSCFEIERRTESNSEWVKIGTVQGSGTTTEIHNYSFLDKNVYSDEVFYYRLKQVDYDGTFAYSKIIKTGNIESPSNFVLNQNYPNPFNPQTNISYSIPVDGNVKLTIVDLLGEELVTLVDESQKPGNYEKTFDGSQFASGIYFYRLVVKGHSGEVFTNTKKMLLIK